jgi:inhibitor of KinA
MIYRQPKYRMVGDRGLLVELGDEMTPAVNQRLRELFLTLEAHPVDGVVELVPGYRSLLTIYDPGRVELEALKRAFEDLLGARERPGVPEPKTLEIPVVYGGPYGPDLAWVARYHRMSPEEVVRLHTGNVYRVYMIGFTPGFPYMGELPEALFTPRRETPRTSVPKGSVGIAQKQTGIYPVESPGGWHIIGRTPLKFFDPEKRPPTPLQMGDRVIFYSIQEEEFSRWKA